MKMNRHWSDYISQGAIPFYILHIFYFSKIFSSNSNIFYAQLLKTEFISIKEERSGENNTIQTTQKNKKICPKNFINMNTGP
jgi:hypothetical protein